MLMVKQKKYNRERVVEAANRLFYEKGYNQTSFADVANELKISKGNITYHFRAKNELLYAVIDYRIHHIKANLSQWSKKYPDPSARLKRFVKMLLIEADTLVRYGCPMGSLNVELGKGQQELQEKSRQMFDLFKQWLNESFKQKGCSDNYNKSNHLLSMAQGAVLMAHTYSDQTLLEKECEYMIDWIDSIS